jgi:hypothetical protein
VIALQLKNLNYKIDHNRLLASGETNELLTFDAELSDGLIPADGKVYRNYIRNWTRNDQSMTWKVRLPQPAKYRISVEYNKERNTDSGTIIVEVNGKPYKASYDGQSVGNSAKLFVTTVELASGEHTIVLRGESFEGQQYMRPMQGLLE